MDQLRTYQRDNFSSLTEVFLLPVEELKLLKRTLHQIIQNEGEDTEARIKAINQLQSVNSQMLNYYSKLPQVIVAVTKTTTTSATAIVAAAATATADNGNHNNSSSNSSRIGYLEYCKNNNPKHPDSCDCHWDEYQV